MIFVKNDQQKQTSTASRFGTLSLSTWTMISIGLGIGSGLFFGEYCAPLSVIGDIFVGLLRMSVLPYIVVSLIANLGRLSMNDSRRLALIGTGVLIVLWVIVLVTVFLLAQALPLWNDGSFFSTAIVDEPEDLDIVSIFIPSNIFASLSENHVPAVVILCICIGLGLSGMHKKDEVVSLLDVLAKVLIRISRSVAKLTPIGVFAISASTAGTISFSDLQRLQAYVVTHSVGALFLGAIVLPWLVVISTPFGYRDVFRVSRNAMLTAFATGKLIVVLPLLIEESERLLEEYKFTNGVDSVPAVDVLYPIAYPFPHVGKLLGILFIPFTAWFLGGAITFTEYPALLLMGLFGYFGGPNLAMPFLLDFMELPHDMFQLFLVLGVLEGRVADALGAMHLTVFSLISMSVFVGRFRLRIRSLIKYLTIVTFLGSCMLLLLQMTLHRTIDVSATKRNLITNMQLLHNPTQSVVINRPSPNPSPLTNGDSLVDRIRRRGIIRVGFNEDSLPFAFLNLKGEIVGFDIDMAHAFAKDLGVSIEFVRFERDTFVEQITNDHFDVVMSGLVGTLERAEAMEHTDSYLDVTLGLVVPDYSVRRFRSLESLQRMKNLKIGFVDLSRGFVARLRKSLPNATLVKLRNNQEYFVARHRDLDALLISAESGSAYTLQNPSFEVVVPDGLKVSLPLFYAISARDEAMKNLLEHWVSLRRKDGTVAEYYNHWILGKIEGDVEPRWSIMRDVLKWVE